MSVTDKNQPVEPSSPCGRKKRRFLSAEKKFQLFLETQRAETPVGEVLRREGLYSTDLARIQRMVKEGALERLAVRPGPAKKTVYRQDYDALKQELQEKERALADMSVELAIFEKKPMGVRGKDKRSGYEKQEKSHVMNRGAKAKGIQSRAFCMLMVNSSVLSDGTGWKQGEGLDNQARAQGSSPQSFARGTQGCLTLPEKKNMPICLIVF